MATKATKKAIATAVKNVNITLVFSLVKRYTGKTMTYFTLKQWLKSNITLSKEAIKSLDKAFFALNRGPKVDDIIYPVHFVAQKMREANNGIGNYAKLPMAKNDFGVYLCSPIFGLKDYNRTMVMVDDNNATKLVAIANKMVERLCK